MNSFIDQDNGSPGTVQKLTRLLAAPIVEPSQRATRIQLVEKDIILPLRLLIIAYLGYFFFFSGWLDNPGRPTGLNPAIIERHLSNTNSTSTNMAQMQNFKQALAQEQTFKEDWPRQNAFALRISFVIYAVLSLAVGATFVWRKNLSLTQIEWIVFTIGIMDAAVIGTLTFITDGFGSNVYWVFTALVVHNAVAIPVAFPQLLLNFLTSISFAVAGVMAVKMNILTAEAATPVSESVERVIVLMAWATCCYGIQLLFEKQKRAEAEATEFAVRQERLRTAGRLAAEIAHQIKNPLGIITNAAFCLNRSLQEGETAVEEQIQIIREEVERADQIITELMGYAQLAEGKVERLEVSEEIEQALQEVFPPAAKYQVKIDRHYAPALPALLMQRRHLSGVLVNLLQNAREAMNGNGHVSVSADYGPNDSIRIAIEDNGPGIPEDRLDKIFEAYFTTREKGTGLGLAIVKHNTEMYGGRIDVKSKLGQGTRFAVEFPSRILMKLSK